MKIFAHALCFLIFNSVAYVEDSVLAFIDWLVRRSVKKPMSSHYRQASESERADLRCDKEHAETRASRMYVL